MSKYPKSIGYTGSRGNIREIYATGRPEEPYEAKFQGGTLGYYLSYDLAYAAIQEALAAHIKQHGRNIR